MEQKIRTFIAIKILPGKRFKHIYSVLQEHLKHDLIRWVPENNFHITLRFLGETSALQTENICLELENIANQFSPFQFNLKGFGFFKRKGKPHVLFAKTEESPTLLLLVNEIEKSIRKLSFRENTKDFKPHLTIGKIKQLNVKNHFFAVVNKSEETSLQKITLSEIIFYQSIIQTEGPIYKAIKTFKLNK